MKFVNKEIRKHVTTLKSLTLLHVAGEKNNYNNPESCARKQLHFAAFCARSNRTDMMWVPILYSFLLCHVLQYTLLHITCILQDCEFNQLYMYFKLSKHNSSAEPLIKIS
jgi:hypothetical protein